MDGNEVMFASFSQVFCSDYRWNRPALEGRYPRPRWQLQEWVI